MSGAVIITWTLFHKPPAVCWSSPRNTGLESAFRRFSVSLRFYFCLFLNYFTDFCYFLSFLYHAFTPFTGLGLETHFCRLVFMHQQVFYSCYPSDSRSKNLQIPVCPARLMEQVPFSPRFSSLNLNIFFKIGQLVLIV